MGGTVSTTDAGVANGATPSATDDDRLAELLARQKEQAAAGDFVAASVTDRCFHAEIVRSGGNEILSRLYDQLRDRQLSDDPTGNTQLAGRVNLLNWDGQGTPSGLFPERIAQDAASLSATADNPGSRPDRGTAGASGGR